MLKNILYSLIYALSYQMVHSFYLFKHFEYMGYKSEGISVFTAIITVFFIILPLWILPKIKGFLEIAFTYLYLLLYIPVVITFLNHYNNLGELVYYQGIFLIGFILIFAPSILTKKKYQPLNDKVLPTEGLIILNLFILFVLLFYFRNSFDIVDFSNVYKHRAEVKISNSFIAYLLLWNTYLIGPLVLIHGLIKRNKFFFILGLLSVISAYGMTASKISLFIPLVIVASFLLMQRTEKIYRSFALSLTSIMLIVFAFADKFFMLSAVILMRTFGISGLLTYQYNEYFQTFPITFLSHINIINYLTGWYPYDQPLGFVVSDFFGDSYNANANFWATDGIAGFGIFGVLIISLVVGFFLSQIKRIERQENTKLLSLTIIPFCFIILNVSFFTALISGGFIMVLIYFLIYRK